MKASDLPLEDGLTMRIPGKIRHHEKNCPGSFYWLQGFGMEEVKVQEEAARSLFPIWGFKAHFKVYSVNEKEFEFASGFKKHYQFSLAGLSECPVIDDLRDLDQLERSPVHEVVDLDDDSEESDSEEERPGLVRAGEEVSSFMIMIMIMMMMMMQGLVRAGEDSIMVVDSDEDEEDEEEEAGINMLQCS